MNLLRFPIATRPLRLLRSFSAKKEFEADSNLLKQNDSRYTVDFNSHWTVSGALNGGFLMSVALKAAMQSLQLDPLSFSGYYMNKAVANTRAEIDVEVLNRTKSTTVAQVSVTQLGQLKTRYMGVFGSYDSLKGHSHSILKAPELPPIAECVDGAGMLRKLVKDDNWTIVNSVEFRAPSDSPYVQNFLSNVRGTQALFEGWVAFADGHIPDVRSLAFFSDGIPPCVLNLTPFAWVPTLEYGVHFWAPPVAPSTEQQQQQLQGYYEGKHWLRARYGSPHVINGTLYTDTELWSADGSTLLATSRQIARVFTPR